MSHLLDTNSWVDHLRRGLNSKVTAKITAAPQGSIFLGSVVLAELLYGAHLGGPAHLANNLALIATLRRQFAALSFDEAAAEKYAHIRAHLKRLGTPIGPNDLFIAALALANNLTLVTHNTVKFSRVPGLMLEDWQ